MARRRYADGEKYIEADNGLGWTRIPISGKWVTTVFGIAYELERRGGSQEDFGWYLFNQTSPSHFWGEYCARTLLPAIDEASEMIDKADLRGEGYEKETGT